MSSSSSSPSSRPVSSSGLQKAGSHDKYIIFEYIDVFDAIE